VGLLFFISMKCVHPTKVKITVITFKAKTRRYLVLRVIYCKIRVIR